MSPSVHTLPSSHVIAVTILCVQTPDAQMSFVHGLPSLAHAAPEEGVPEQVPDALHVSPLVHGLVSLQLEPAGRSGALQCPLESHMSGPVHGLPSLQLRVGSGVDTHAPVASQTSLVHGLPSLHEAPTRGVPTQWPAPSHISLCMHWLPESQERPDDSGVPTHMPPVQRALPMHSAEHQLPSRDAVRCWHVPAMQRSSVQGFVSLQSPLDLHRGGPVVRRSRVVPAVARPAVRRPRDSRVASGVVPAVARPAVRRPRVDSRDADAPDARHHRPASVAAAAAVFGIARDVRTRAAAQRLVAPAIARRRGERGHHDVDRAAAAADDRAVGAAGCDDLAARPPSARVEAVRGGRDVAERDRAGRAVELRGVARHCRPGPEHLAFAARNDRAARRAGRSRRALADRTARERDRRAANSRPPPGPARPPDMQSATRKPPPRILPCRNAGRSLLPSAVVVEI